MFLLLCLWERVLFYSGASHSFVAASCVKELGLKDRNLGRVVTYEFSLRTWGCELEISRILLTVDLRVMDMSEFDVILGMDWMTAHRVIIDCDRKRVIAYTLGGSRFIFQGDKHDALPQTVYDSRWHGQLQGWLASLTLEDELRQELGLPRVVCKYEDVFLQELLGLPPHRDVNFVIKLHPRTSPIYMTSHRMALAEL